MDPISLAATVIGVVSPYFAKGAQELISHVGQEAYEKTKQLVTYLKDKWTGNDEASSTLENFEQKPKRHEQALQDILVEQLSNDPQLAAEVEKQVNELKPYLEVFQKMKKGEDVVGIEADEMKSGAAKVTQEIEEGKNIKAAVIKRIG